MLKRPSRCPECDSDQNFKRSVLIFRFDTHPLTAWTDNGNQHKCPSKNYKCYVGFERDAMRFGWDRPTWIYGRETDLLYRFKNQIYGNPGGVQGLNSAFCKCPDGDKCVDKASAAIPSGSAVSDQKTQGEQNYSSGNMYSPKLNDYSVSLIVSKYYNGKHV